MIRLLMIILAAMLAVPAMGAVSKSGLSNPYVAQAEDPQGMGVPALITQWVHDAALMDHQTIIASRNISGLVPLNLADGLAYLCRTTTGRIGDTSDVIDTLRGLVARYAQSDGEREVAVIGLLYITKDAQSIDLSLDFLLARPQQLIAIAAILSFLKGQCFLTQAQQQRIASAAAPLHP